ncbi:MAG TPA: hypothetical protein VIY56_18220, partial [Vicinamibacterales bacterium]
MPVSTRTVLVAALCAAGAIGVPSLLAQRSLAELGGRLIGEYPLSAIDVGLRDQDPPRPPRTASATYVPGSLIVKFRAGTGALARRAMATSVQGDVAAALSNADFEIVRLNSGADAELMAARLSAQPDVDYAQARYRVRPMYVPNDPLYSLQWNFPALDMERAWDINTGGSAAITVAVLDSGVAYRS